MNERQASDKADRLIDSFLRRVYGKDPDFDEFQLLTGGLFTSAIRDSVGKIPVIGVNSLALYTTKKAGNNERDILEAYAGETEDMPGQEERERQVDKMKNTRKVADLFRGAASAVEASDTIKTLAVEDFEEDVEKTEELLGEKGKYSTLVRIYDLVNAGVGMGPTILPYLIGLAKTTRSDKINELLEGLYRNTQSLNILTDIGSICLRLYVVNNAFKMYKELKGQGYQLQETDNGYQLARE